MVATVKLDKSQLKKILRPTIYTTISVFFLIYFLINFQSTSIKDLVSEEYLLRYEIATFGTIVITILLSITYYIGYIQPKNSIRRGFYLLIASIFILIEAILWLFTGYIEIAIKGVGLIIIDSTPLLMWSLLLIICLVFKKTFDLYDSWKDRGIYSKVIEKSYSKDQVGGIEIIKRSDYEYFISEARENGCKSFNQILQYFINNHFIFDKKKLRRYSY